MNFSSVCIRFQSHGQGMRVPTAPRARQHLLMPIFHFSHLTENKVVSHCGFGLYDVVRANLLWKSMLGLIKGTLSLPNYQPPGPPNWFKVSESLNCSKISITSLFRSVWYHLPSTIYQKSGMKIHYNGIFQTIQLWIELKKHSTEHFLLVTSLSSLGQDTGVAKWGEEEKGESSLN